LRGFCTSKKSPYPAALLTSPRKAEKLKLNIKSPAIEIHKKGRQAKHGVKTRGSQNSCQEKNFRQTGGKQPTGGSADCEL